MNVSFFQELLTTISERGRQLLDFSGITSSQTIESLSQTLLSERGEASGVALAQQILQRYEALDADKQLAFFRFLAESQVFTPNIETVKQAAQLFLDAPNSEGLKRLRRAVESPRAEYLHRLNLAPGATAKIVRMRADLLRHIKGNAGLASVDADFVQLLISWFNRGFLVLQRIDWTTPASILDKIIRYEAVHEIKGWDDLRRRLDPADRRCFAYFHPSLVDEPLIFVQVALTRDIPASIQNVLGSDTRSIKPNEPTTAVFYSISNCQEGLRGISFGNFLIKQVVDDLSRTIPSLKTFVTLSPVPGFTAWLDRAKTTNILTYLDATQLAILDNLADPDWLTDAELVEELKPVILTVAAHYFLAARNVNGRPIDPVARFHLGNGARLERLNWCGDVSPKGMAESHGLMVNYLYELRDIERNHETYANSGTIAASKAVRSLLKIPDKAKIITSQETE